MRLRYLSLQDAPPLQDLAIPFWQEMVMGRDCAIRFVVGVNGSGKSRLLLALAQIFLTIEQLPDAKFPFFLTLVYDLVKDGEKKTIFLQHKKKEEGAASSKLIIRQYDWLSDDVKYDWEDFIQVYEFKEEREYNESSGGKEAFLPKALIIYSSGVVQSWHKIFAPPLPPATSLPLYEQDEERPLNWTISDERQYKRMRGDKKEADNLKSYFSESALGNINPSIGFFLDSKQLRLSILAVSLLQAKEDFKEMTDSAAEKILLNKWDESTEDNHSQSGFRQLLNEIGWRYPVCVGFKINLQPNEWSIPKEERSLLKRLFESASRVIGEPEPGNGRTVFYDVRENRGKGLVIDDLVSLFQELDKKQVTAFDIFKRLYRWQKVGILQDVVIAIKKRGVDDLMLFDWLSDGEQLFLGRMSMFHLLEGENDVIALLDEPETHFNDVWKRRIVDVIDDSLRDTHNEIVITTHSSIALTDVFKREVTRLKFGIDSEGEGKVIYIENRTDTFGASPSVIMREIFGAEDSVGQRAAEFLDLILMLATKPTEVDAVWRNYDSASKLEKSSELSQLALFVKEAQRKNELPHDYGKDDKELKSYLVRILISIKKYVEKEKNIEKATVVEALLTLENIVGEGYYQFEIRRRLRALQKPDN